jgi:hypothetical protein
VCLASCSEERDCPFRSSCDEARGYCGRFDYQDDDDDYYEEWPSEDAAIDASSFDASGFDASSFDASGSDATLEDATSDDDAHVADDDDAG